MPSDRSPLTSCHAVGLRSQAPMAQLRDHFAEHAAGGRIAAAFAWAHRLMAHPDLCARRSGGLVHAV